MRSGRAPWFLAALAWLLVVAAVGSVTYLVVDNAGRGIGDTSQTRPLAAAATVTPTPTATPSPTPTRSSPRPSRTPTRTASPEPTRTPATTQPPAPAPSTPRPTRTAAPAPAPTRTPTPTPTSATRTFTTAGGTVVASCTGGVVRLDSITPRNGWSFERELEDGYVEVKFHAAEAEEIELKIGCRSGVPTQVHD